ncbi:MAG: ribonuclease H family protein [Candidatus Methylomirabilota bacterium]
MAPVYVILAPDTIKGICATWGECRAKVTGVSGAKFQKVSSRDAAQAMIEGTADRIPPGTFAFVDGNHRGGVGVVLVHRTATGDTTRKEISTTLTEVFPAGFTLEDGRHLSADEALATIRNIACEIAATYVAVQRIQPNTRLTIVHDYEGIGAWLMGRWRVKDPIVAAIITRVLDRIHAANLHVSFQHQRGHQADRLGLNEWIQENRRADALATQVVA